MLSNDTKPHTIDVTTQMEQSFWAAHQRYMSHLDETRKYQAKEKTENAKEICSEIKEVQVQISDLEKVG